MTFFSLLYDEEKEVVHNSQNWLEFKKRSITSKDKQYEYVGNKLVRVEQKEETMMYPAFYKNLNLEGIIEKIYGQETFGQLQDVFTHLLGEKENIYYRQEIMQDLEQQGCYEAFVQFRNELKEVQRLIDYSEESINPWQKDSYRLKAICLYCQDINTLRGFYNCHEVRSEGLKRLKSLLTEYVEEEQFKTLSAVAHQLQVQFEGLTYKLKIEEKRVVVILEDQEVQSDYIQHLGRLMGQEDLNPINIYDGIKMGQLKTKIIEILAKKHKGLFQKAHQFVEENRVFISDVASRVEKELVFYIPFIDYMHSLKAKGFVFCYPKISRSKKMLIKEMYDLSLIDKKIKAEEIVGNELMIDKNEKGACITGANQGGKTTYIRAVGQVAYLAALGLPVPAKVAELFAYEKIYTHFTESENQYTSNGKLKEELLKVRRTLRSVDDKGLVLMNEIFSSTTMKDGLALGKQAIEQLIAAGATVFCVTHIIRLAQENLGLVNLVAEVNESGRSYRIIRKEVDGMAYTKELVQKYRLTYKEIKERLTHEN